MGLLGAVCSESERETESITVTARQNCRAKEFLNLRCQNGNACPESVLLRGLRSISRGRYANSSSASVVSVTLVSPRSLSNLAAVAAADAAKVWGQGRRDSSSGSSHH